MTKLYNTADKRRACTLEQALLQSDGDLTTYMPYRDTNEDNIQGEWKKEVFNRDIAELDKCDAVIGYWDGPAFDEGIGFEIGYAISKNKRVIIINDDFLTYGSHNDPDRFRFPDPIVVALNIPLVGKIFRMTTIYTFESDLDISAHNTYYEASLILKQLLLLPVACDWLHIRHNNKRIFIDTGNSDLTHSFLTEYARKYGYSISTRFQTKDRISGAQHDIQNALSAQKVYISNNGQEMSPGSSILCGLCYGHHIPFYIINDRKLFPYSMSNIEMRTNLMIDVACDGYINYGDLR